MHPHRYMAMLAAITLNKHNRVYINSTLLAPISSPSTDAQLQRQRAMVNSLTPERSRRILEEKKKIEAVVDERI